MDDESDALNVRTFRVSIVTGAVTYVVWIGTGYTAEWMYSQEESDLMQWAGYGAILPPTPVYPWLSLLVYLVASAGLYRFSLAARLIFTALVGVNTVVGALSGICVSTGLDSLIGGCLMLCIGGITMAAWTPPLRDRFPPR